MPGSLLSAAEIKLKKNSYCPHGDQSSQRKNMKIIVQCDKFNSGSVYKTAQWKECLILKMPLRSQWIIGDLPGELLMWFTKGDDQEFGAQQRR